MNLKNPDSMEAAHAVYRLSCLAYANTVMTVLFVIVVSISIGQWTAHNTQSDAGYRFGMAVSVFILVVSLSVCIYNIFFLKSVRLYTDNVGVWIYRGVLPWSKGGRGVKWRDIEDAMYNTGFLSWMLDLYTVRFGHRFTKTSGNGAWRA